MYVSCYFWYWLVQLIAFSALTLLVRPQEEHPAWPVKIEWWGVGVVICLEWCADRLHIVQLMPLHLKTPSSLAYLNPDWFYLSGTCLPRFPYHFIFSGQLLFLAPNQQCCKCFSWLEDEFTEWCAFLAFPVSAHFLCCYFCGRRNLIGRSVGRSIDWLMLTLSSPLTAHCTQKLSIAVTDCHSKSACVFVCGSLISADINGNVRALSYALNHPLVFGANSTQATQRKQQIQPRCRVINRSQSHSCVTTGRLF